MYKAHKSILPSYLNCLLLILGLDNSRSNMDESQKGSHLRPNDVSVDQSSQKENDDMNEYWELAVAGSSSTYRLMHYAAGSRILSSFSAQF